MSSSSTPSQAQGELHDLFLHGSEETRSTPPRANNTQPARDQESDDEVVVTDHRPPPGTTAIGDYAPEELAMMLDEIGAGAQASRIVLASPTSIAKRWLKP